MARINRVGVDNNAPVGTCMVVGCTKTALYRNASTVRQTKTERGYCSTHKALAVCAPPPDPFLDYVASRADD